MLVSLNNLVRVFLESFLVRDLLPDKRERAGSPHSVDAWIIQSVKIPTSDQAFDCLGLLCAKCCVCLTLSVRCQLRDKKERAEHPHSLDAWITIVISYLRIVISYVRIFPGAVGMYALPDDRLVEISGPVAAVQTALRVCALQLRKYLVDRSAVPHLEHPVSKPPLTASVIR